MVSALHTGMMEVERSALLFFFSFFGSKLQMMHWNSISSFYCLWYVFYCCIPKEDEFVSFEGVVIDILLQSLPSYKFFLKVPSWETAVFNSILKKPLPKFRPTTSANALVGRLEGIQLCYKPSFMHQLNCMAKCTTMNIIQHYPCRFWHIFHRWLATIFIGDFISGFTQLNFLVAYAAQCPCMTEVGRTTLINSCQSVV